MALLDQVTCEEFVRNLPSFLDREVTAGDRQELEAHLATCVRCLRKFHFERTLLDRIRNRLQAVAVPAALKVRIEALIRASDRDDPG